MDQKKRSLIPIFLITFGRNGSTFFMHILASSRRIAFDRSYPYEARDLSYLYRLAQFAVQGARPDDWTPDSIIRGDMETFGPYPHRRDDGTFFQGKEAPFRLFSGMWQSYTDHVRNTQQNGFPDAVYYAEKVPQSIWHTLSPLTYTKNIFLIRDPRDEFISIKQFNEKRGYRAFGWGEDETDQDYALRLCHQRRNFMRHVIRHEETDRRILFRYEDVMTDLDATVARLEAFLDLKLDMDEIQQSTTEMKAHMTAGSQRKSVARWRDAMDVDLQKIFEDEIGEELAGLGYL